MRSDGASRPVTSGRHQVQASRGTARGTSRAGSTRRSAAARTRSGASIRRAPANGRRVSRRNGNARAALGIGAIVLSLLLVFLLVKSVVGCVSRASDRGDKKTEAPAEQEVVETVAETKPVTIDLVMIGDILQHSWVYQSGFHDDGTRNYDHIFAHIGSEIEGADIKVVNQETILGGDSFTFSGYPAFNGPQEMGDAEVKAGFNVALRATNHALDYGYDGLHSELAYWREKHPEVAVIGAWDPEDPSSSLGDTYIFEKDGFKVALLNFTYGTNDIPDPDGRVSLLEESHVRSAIEAAEAQADMVVVFPHWGEEYNLTPVQDQYDMAEVMMEAGADVIIGGHPHVIEPVEVLTAPDGHKVPCFWSVGNFVSTQIDNQNLVGGVAKVTMEKASDGSCSVTACSFVPTITHKGTSTDMTTYLLRDYTDDLASSNYLAANDTDNTSLTVAWANDFCTQVLGPGFDTTSEQLVINPSELVASAPSATDATSSTEAEADASAEEDAEQLDEAA